MEEVDLVNGSASINIDIVSNMTDGTFILLNRDIQCTSNETGWTAVKGSVSGNILTITAQDISSTDTISWMVIGENKMIKLNHQTWILLMLMVNLLSNHLQLNQVICNINIKKIL